MNIKYFFLICSILLIFLSLVKASECRDFQGKTSFIHIHTIFSSDLFLIKENNSLINKVILPTHPGNHDIFWKNIVIVFQIAKCVYTNLGIYLYSSIFSIFKW